LSSNLPDPQRLLVLAGVGFNDPTTALCFLSQPSIHLVAPIRNHDNQPWTRFDFFGDTLTFLC
jgi:hypothetical protein